MSETFKVDMPHLQKVQRTLRKAGNIFPNETALIETLEDLIIKAQDDTSLNTYYSMAQYLKQRVKELRSHLDAPLKRLKRRTLTLIGRSIISNGSLRNNPKRVNRLLVKSYFWIASLRSQ